MKKSGEKCTAIVNKNRCEFCLYHIKQEYQKCSQRSELQSNFAGRGLTALRNKVLGKNEVFYAGKSYMAIPAKKSRKMDQMDTNRLNCLSGKNDGIEGAKAKTKPAPKRKAASKLDVPQAQRMKDIELLKKLGGLTEIENKNNFSGNRSTEITLEESKNIATSVISKLKAKTNDDKLIEKNENKIDLSVSYSSGISLEESKSTALSVINKLKAKKMDVTMTDFAENNSAEETKINEPLDNNLPDNSFSVDKEFAEFESLDYDDDNDDSIAQLQSKTHKAPKNNTSTTPANKKSSPKASVSNGKMNIHIPKEAESTKSTFLFNKSPALTFPKLSGFEPGKMIDLNKPMSRQMTKAKLNAIKLIKKSGPIEKADPNNTRGSGKKRAIEEITENSSAKKSKLAESEFISDRFKKMMAMTSSHMDLLEARDEEAAEKYFNKLEAKEQMEEKMTNTFKMACKAVKCLKCKYTSFSASDLCKTERHPLRVFDAMKRFFKCGNCGNRTVSLEIIPTRPCTNCGSGKWEKTGMMKEKLVTAAHSLSIRGGEQKFANSVVSDANINLLVPDS
ncbi:unnamed protein product [Phaedon cochleariae]|uniref:Replication factor Mcm10 C-terminal domain-containing protein n=1 Tax=Phaedon cochleariae TaxID=80249 RepID=A0A9N9SJS0_PHACE|nr:unnamed protein product [Phaedon cochleariae]